MVVVRGSDGGKDGDASVVDRETISTPQTQAFGMPFPYLYSLRRDNDDFSQHRPIARPKDDMLYLEPRARDRLNIDWGRRGQVGNTDLVCNITQGRTPRLQGVLNKFRYLPLEPKIPCSALYLQSLLEDIHMLLIDFAFTKSGYTHAFVNF